MWQARQRAVPGPPACSVARAFSAQAPAAPVAERTSFGGLKDEDRIFQNIYGRHDLSLKVGRPRVVESAPCSHLLKMRGRARRARQPCPGPAASSPTPPRVQRLPRSVRPAGLPAARRPRGATVPARSRAHPPAHSWLRAGCGVARRLVQDQGPDRQGLRLDCGSDEEERSARAWRCRVPVRPEVELHAQGAYGRAQCSAHAWLDHCSPPFPLCPTRRHGWRVDWVAWHVSVHAAPFPALASSRQAEPSSVRAGGSAHRAPPPPPSPAGVGRPPVLPGGERRRVGARYLQGVRMLVSWLPPSAARHVSTAWGTPMPAPPHPTRPLFGSCRTVRSCAMSPTSWWRAA